MNITMTVDEETHEAIKSMPRNMSASRVLRHFVRAVMFNDKEWDEYAKTDECRMLRAYIKPYKQRLGM